MIQLARICYICSNGLLLQHMLMRLGILGMFLCVLTFGQTFETASVKRAVAGDRVRTSMRDPGSADPGQITFTSVTLMNVLLRAYDVKSFQAVGPDWLNSERYDVLAKVPEGTSKEQCNLMLQHLLAERFHLSAHQEKRQLQGYELVVGKSGSKLKASSEIDEVSGEEAGPPKGGRQRVSTIGASGNRDDGGHKREIGRYLLNGSCADAGAASRATEPGISFADFGQDWPPWQVRFQVGIRARSPRCNIDKSPRAR